MTTGQQYRLQTILTIILFLIYAGKLFSNNFIITSESKWTAYVLYVKDGKAPILKNPSEQADTVKFVYYRDKLLIIEEEWSKFGWKKIVYPVTGYINEKSLMTLTEKTDLDKKYETISQENENSKWDWEKISCSNDFVLVKNQMDEGSETVGLLKDYEQTVVIKEQFNFKGVWIKTVYPFKGYIRYFDAFEGKRYPYLALGVTYGAKHIPYEKNLQNYFNPIGGYFEYSKANWILGFRLGFIYTESRLSTFYVKTNQFYFHIVYRFLKLFNAKLETYALAGANYWTSSFENTKYGPDNTYFKLEKDSGPGYILGAGIIYYLNSFFIEAQYNIFLSRQAEFGSKPTQGSFTNYSTLYPGSNNFEIIFGYRFIL